MIQSSGDFKSNNFNIIRIYLSVSVVFFHCYELSGKSELILLNKFFNGDRAVEAFFIISGYMVMKSFLRSSSTKEFFFKRVRRIYPAYIFVILFSVLAGAFVSAGSIADYFGSARLYQYFFANIVFLNFIEPSLPGVFENNIFKAVNGSLWTLKIEVAYYIVVPLIVLLRRKINVHVLYALLFSSSLAYYFFMKHQYEVSGSSHFLFLSRQIPGQLFYFIAGAWVAEIEGNNLFKIVIQWAGIPCIILLFLPFPLFAQIFILTTAVFYLAFIVPALHYPYKHEDISYGLYIYHFPVIQLLVTNGIYEFSPLAGVSASVMITLCFAVVSWFFVEKPFVMYGRKKVLS